jgi:hypothetical protein
LVYSNRNDKGHYGVPKIILGESGVASAFYDSKGEYAMTQGAIGIVIEDKEEAEKMLEVLKSESFGNLVLSSCLWSNFRIDAKLFMHLRKDFWKSFISQSV